jgi:hypothetical protein
MGCSTSCGLLSHFSRWTNESRIYISSAAAACSTYVSTYLLKPTMIVLHDYWHAYTAVASVCINVPAHHASKKINENDHKYMYMMYHDDTDACMPHDVCTYKQAGVHASNLPGNQHHVYRIASADDASSVLHPCIAHCWASACWWILCWLIN